MIFESQLNGDQVRAVALHTKSHAVHATLKNGHKVIVALSPSQQSRLIDAVKAHGITVKVTKAQTPSHKRRDIIIAVVVVVVVLALVALWLFLRRRRIRQEELGPEAPASS